MAQAKKKKSKRSHHLLHDAAEREEAGSTVVEADGNNKDNEADPDEIPPPPAKKPKSRNIVASKDVTSADQGDLDSSQPSVACPPFSGVFDSWKAMESAFARYQRETFEMYKLRTSNSIKDRNQSRTQQAAKRGTKPNL
ncbi:hypothetical protein PF008_g4630 [Phytophthora fragariae]|uniref:Uncharacterized protein n=1 Tax=Phytophthora fragariae TaxID=53985 RepID=A0A6G0SCE5_9STRA|nr:hypothetical protein PF008_g4630 [Phytophthora fragariae]